MSDLSLEAYRDVYERKYAPHWDTGRGFNPPIARHLDAFRLILDLRGIKSVLDVGCGPGQLLRLLDAACLEVHGCEVVDALFRRQLRGFGVKLGGLPNLPYPDLSVDCACAIDVLEHLEETDIDPAIDDLARVTRKWLLTEVNSKPYYWIMGDGTKVDLHRTQRPWAWWRERIGRRFEEVTARGAVVAWVKKRMLLTSRETA